MNTATESKVEVIPQLAAAVPPAASPVVRFERAIQAAALILLGVAALFFPLFWVLLILALPVVLITSIAVRIGFGIARRRRERKFSAAVVALPNERDGQPPASETVVPLAEPAVDPLSPRSPRQMRRGAYIAVFGFGGALLCAVILGLFPLMNAVLIDAIRRVCLGIFILGLLLVVEGNIRWERRGRRIVDALSAAFLPRDPRERKWIHGYLLLFPMLAGFLVWSFVLVTMTFGYVAIAAATLYCLVRGPRTVRRFFLTALVASLIWPLANVVLLSIELPPLSYGRGQLTTAGWCVVLFEWSAVVVIPGAGFFGQWIMDAIVGDRGQATRA